MIAFQRITTKVKNNMNEVERLQTQLRALETRDRSLIEDLFVKVNFWSACNLIAVLSILAIQLFTIRSFFNDNSKFGRLIRKGRLND